MDKYKKTNFRSVYIGLIGAVVLLALVSSSGLYAPAYGRQQLEPQQSSTIEILSSDENMTGTTTSAASAGNATTTTENVTTTNATAPNATLVEFVSNIEQIRGHLDQAVINKEAGNNTLAEAHVHHPIEEVYSSIEVELANQNSTLNQTLADALQSLTSSVMTAELAEFQSQVDNIDMLLNNSVQAVVPSSELDNVVVFNPSVVARLLDIAGHEYEEAVANGTIVAVVEYQDGQAFIDRAMNIFNSAAGRIDPSMAPEVGEVNEYFSILNTAVMNMEEPSNVGTTITGIIHELAEITGLPENQLVGEEGGAAEQDPIAIIENIKLLLSQQLLDAYRAQDFPGAEGIAIEAYLENYEFIEAAIAEHDRELMEQTEVMLREELRQMITDRAPVEQIEQHINMIIANLDRAAGLLQ
jgi:hypothetical protein